MNTQTDQMLLPDQVLLRRLPDDEAVRVLVDRYSRIVYSASYRILRNADQADDATQAVFLTMLGRSHELERHVSLAGWLYITAVRTSLAMARSESARRKREKIAALSQFQDSVGSCPSVDGKLGFDLVNAITTLNDVDREVLLLRYAQELTHDEIGARVNLSSDAVRMRHDRAIGKLRSRFAAQNLGAILPLVFQAHPRVAPATTQIFGSGGWKSLINTARHAPTLKLTSVQLVAAAVGIAPLAGIGLWYAGLTHAKLGNKPHQTRKQSTVPAQPWLDGDCVVAFETFHGSQKFAVNPDTQSTNFGQGIDMGNWAPNNSILDGFVIPHLDDHGVLNCDIKARVRQDEWDNTGLGQMLKLPVLATFHPKPGQPFYCVVTPGFLPTARCYGSRADFKLTNADDLFIITATPHRGRKEDKNFWKEHVASGPFDDQVLSAKPASGIFEITAFIHDKPVKTATVLGTNRKWGEFTVIRPVGIRCELWLGPEKQPSGDLMTHFQFLEFTQPGVPNATPQRFFSGHKSRYGMQGMLNSDNGDVWIARSAIDPMKADMCYGSEPKHSPLDTVFRIKTIETH